MLQKNVTVFGDRVFKELIQVKRGHMSDLIQHDWCPYEKRRLGHKQTQNKHHVKDTRRRRPSTSQGQGLQRKPTLLTP